MTLLCVSESALPGGAQGEQRKLFDMVVDAAGGDSSEVIHVGVRSTQRIGEAKALYEPMEDTLRRLRPSKVIALGGTAATVVKRAKTKVAITKARGLAEWLDYDGGRAMLVSTVSPSLVLRRAGNSEGLNAAGAREWFRDLYRDVTKWVHQDEPMPALDPAIWVPDSADRLLADLSELDSYEVISCDLETEPDAGALADLRAREHAHGKAACAGCSG